MKTLVRWLFEVSPWDPFTSAWLAGYVTVKMDGLIYLTEAGSDYLDSLPVAGCELCAA